MNCIPSVSVVLIVFAIASDVDGVSTFAENINCLIMLFILFVLAQLPWCYSFSYVFAQPASAIMYTNIANVILCQALFITIFILTLNAKLTKIRQSFSILFEQIFVNFETKMKQRKQQSG